MRTENVLKIISQIPLLILFVFSSYFLYLSYQNYKNVELLDSSISENSLLSKLSIEIAAERDLSNAYINSDGLISADLLSEQRKDRTNGAIEKFIKYYNAYPSKNNQLTESVKKLLGQLSSVRNKVDNLDAVAGEIFFDYYSNINSLILQKMQESVSLTTINSQITSLNMALVSAYHDIEYTGQERGFMSGILGAYSPISENNLHIWTQISSKSNTLDSVAIQSESAKIAIKNLINSAEVKRVYSDIEQEKSSIILASATGEFLIDPVFWFRMMSKKIEIIGEMASIIENNLNAEINKFNQSTIKQIAIAASIWIFSVIWLILGFSLTRVFNNNVKELSKVFSRVDELAGSKEKLDLRTLSNTSKAYQIIDKALENITEEKRKAEDASAAKSIFLANMSHEIRTPLNGIIGFTDLLKNTDIDGEKREFVEVIEKSSENLLSIINNVLDLSKIESNKVDIDEIPFLPIPEFENAIEVYGPKASEKDIQLAAYIDPSLTNYIKGDITKIKEVIINLMSNAVKFTPQSGSITVTIKRMESVREMYARIYFCVEDSGIGIPKSKMDDIFNAFSQADSTITRKYGGTGLGLTISSKYITMMNGKLDVESHEGKGSKFFFTIDLIETPSSEPHLENRYNSFTAAILSKPEIQRNHEQFIKEYFDYFGVTPRGYSTFENLKELIYKAGVNSIVADFDSLNEDELAEYKKVRLPILLIMKPHHQKRFEEFNTEYITTVFEPINVSKLVKFLDSAKDLIPKEILQPTQQNVTQSTDDNATNSFIQTSNTNISINPMQLGNSKMFDAKVLVAEDNEINQRLIKRTLEDLGLSITTVQNGLLAFEARQKEKFDMIFMDIAMPVMDGVEATHQILKYEKENQMEHIPIVAITANALKGDRERFMSEGLDEYITKPIRKDSILRVLNMFIPNKAVADPKEEEALAKKFASIISDDTLESNHSNIDNNQNIDSDPKSDIKEVEYATTDLENNASDSISFDDIGSNIDDLEKDIDSKDSLDIINFDEDIASNDASNSLNEIIFDEQPSDVINTDINVDDISSATQKIDEVNSKDIIVFKKSPIETKIFTSVISKFNESIDSANSFDEFKELIASTHYNVLIIDKEVDSEEGFENMLLSLKDSNEEHSLGKTKVIMFYDDLQEPSSYLQELVDTVRKNSISRNKLKAIIEEKLEN